MLGLVKSPLIVGTLQVAGPLFFLGLQGSSVRTALEILHNRSVGGYAFLPFASLLTNCIIWSFYGLLKKDNTVLVPNALGVLSGLICVGSYKSYAQSSDVHITVGSAVILFIATSFYLSGSVETLGYMGCALAVLLMGSPLAAMSTVIRDKSTSSMPFFTSFTTWCNALCWSMYGLLVANDPIIYGPNLLGLTLASIQMGLFGLYGLPKEVSHAAGKKDPPLTKDIASLF